MNQVSNIQLSQHDVENRIFTFRGMQVMIDRDLAEMYEVETKVLNQAVKRNVERFPKEFRFQLTDLELDKLVTNCDRFEILKHSSTLPYAFTEQGVAMLSAVLRSSKAILVSIQIMNAFVEIRKVLQANSSLLQRLDRIEQKQLQADDNFERIFKALEKGTEMPSEGIFFDGQIFDAYKFVADLVKSAKKSLVVIDNYVDETVLTLFSKAEAAVETTIYTHQISKQFQLDIDKYNAQYKPIEVRTFTKSHDRFLIIDNKTVYHIGASLKDLGKKWFAFSKMEMDANELIQKLENNISL